MRPQQTSRMYYQHLEGREGNESLKEEQVTFGKAERHREEKNTEVDAQTGSGTLLNGTIQKTSCKYQG